MPASSTIAPAPSAPAPQHLEALARANRVRRARAALKRSVASGQRAAAEVILECPWESKSMPLSELLAAQRRWGLTRTRRFLMPLEISEAKQVGTLTPRQRMLLASGLKAKAAEVVASSRAPKPAREVQEVAPQLVAEPAAA